MDPITLTATATTSALVSLGTALATKGAEGPAHTLNLLWKISFGRWDAKMENMVKEQTKKYAQDIDNEINIGLESLCCGEMSNRLNKTEVNRKSVFDYILAVTRNCA